MTTRDATPLLTRRTESAVRRSPADWMELLAFGAIQWPWLLRSLNGGSRADKANLLSRLGLEPDALPKLGGWKADLGLLFWIVDHIDRARPASVVELGAGATTLVMARAMQVAGYHGRIVSFDQHEDFVAATRTWLADHGLSVDLRHAPIVSPTLKWRDLWYDLDGVPETIDLLVIDGPPWTIRPSVRAEAERLFSRVPIGGTVVLDDAARPGERLVARRWRRNWPQFDWEFRPGIKGMLIGTRISG
jgi:predicted O-methyltransferase YrrM